ncbi:MAG: DUF3800 domain-containing protein [Planctomycetota bacterium]|jgi:hypothetical protein
MIGFQVYIDESGDEGFTFYNDGRGSSRWFVLSAVIIRKDIDLSTVKLVDKVRARLQRTHRTALHFKSLKHEHRLPLLEEIAKSNLRTVSVLIHKPSIREPEKFTGKYQLYRYASRYLLERVSWYCRDHRRDNSEIAKVIFSNRASMSYGELRDYLDLLKKRTHFFGVRIDWSVIDSKYIVADQHNHLMGLQIADAVASGMWHSVEKTPQGFIEPRYAEMLRPVVYSHRSNVLGYGIKFWPLDIRDFQRELPELEWVNRIYT